MNKQDNKIAEEIITYKFTGEETLEDLIYKFHEIMKKHKISRTSSSYNDEGKKVGEIGNRFEWTLYETLWYSTVKRHLELKELFGHYI